MMPAFQTKRAIHKNRLSSKATDQMVAQTPRGSSIIALLFALSRGPILWLCGVSLLSIVFISLWEHIPHKSFIPLVLLVGLSSLTLWTLICCSLFGMDVYTRIVQPLVLKPVLLNATQYSMDDILRTICDPTQLATFLSACWMVPVTLYTVPTTEQQRAQVLSAAGILPRTSTTDQQISQTFTQPGGWVSLFPEWFQNFAQPMICDVGANSGCFEENPVESKHYAASEALLRESKVLDSPMNVQDVTSASTVDEDDSDDDMHETATSPQHMPKSTSSTQMNGTEFASSTKPFATRVSLATDTSAPHEERELPELFFQIWMDVIQNKWDRFLRRLQEQRSNIAITALVTCTVLWLQIRYSPTARKTIRTVAHMLLTTSATVTLLGSTMALLTPYIYETWLKQPHPTAPLGPNVRLHDSRHLPKLLLSLLSTLRIKIPQSMPTTKDLAKKLHRFVQKWKGTMAVFVLAYFRYQQQRRKLGK